MAVGSTQSLTEMSTRNNLWADCLENVEASTTHIPMDLHGLLTVIALPFYGLCNEEPGWRSRYSDWLRARRPRGRSSSPGEVKNFLFSMSSRPALGSTQAPIQWVPGALSPGVKRPGREDDHSPPASAEVNKMWIYTPTPPHAFSDTVLN
jgi:hypothetical protein